MNSDPDAIKVLCYGDSNTWGQTDNKSGRQPVDIRWTGLLQKKLGQEFYVIEEGLPSRTTNLDYSKSPGRNGQTYLIPCLASHLPIDVVVLMLGTNDLKTEYNRPVEKIANAIDNLLNDIEQYGRYMNGEPPKIILVSPIHVDISAPEFKNFYYENYNDSAGSKSENLAHFIKPLADKHNCEFIDAATVARPGTDGIHLSTDSHEPLASLVYNKIKSIQF